MPYTADLVGRKSSAAMAHVRMILRDGLDQLQAELEEFERLEARLKFVDPKNRRMLEVKVRAMRTRFTSGEFRREHELLHRKLREYERRA
jgi:hypothetical protein